MADAPHLSFVFKFLVHYDLARLVQRYLYDRLLASDLVADRKISSWPQLCVGVTLFFFGLLLGIRMVESRAGQLVRLHGLLHFFESLFGFAVNHVHELL